VANGSWLTQKSVGFVVKILRKQKFNNNCLVLNKKMKNTYSFSSFLMILQSECLSASDLLKMLN